MVMLAVCAEMTMLLDSNARLSADGSLPRWVAVHSACSGVPCA